MSPTQRNLLAATLALVVGGAVGMGAGWLRQEIDETPSVHSGTGVAPVTNTTPEEAEAEGPSAPFTPSRVDVEWASLEVRVVDPHGAPLPQATIRATLEASNEALQARGRAFWTELQAGRWQLEVEHADYPTHRTGVHLEPSKSRRHIVQLDTQLPVRGRVIDRFGRPRAATRLWFLGPGQHHPQQVTPGSSQLGASCDRRGRFAIDLPEAGPWRVSLGPPGDLMVAMQHPRELHYGDTAELEVVVGDSTRLEVVCTSDTTERIYVRILRRTETRDTESLPDEGTQPPSLVGGETGKARGAAGDPSSQRVGVDPSPWVTFAGRLLVDGRVVFDRLPAGEELRFAVQRVEVLHKSASSFTLPPDQHARIEFELEPIEWDAEGDARPLAMRFHTTPLQNDERPDGFHWRE